MNFQVKDVFQLSRYLFIFAHPDDEVYTCAFIKELVTRGKVVDLLYVTSGDYQGPKMVEIREVEVAQSMRELNISMTNVQFMRIPERQLMQRVSEVHKNALALAVKLMPECVVGHDFEGGHNGHDAVSYCALRVAEEIKTPLYVFPAYHAWPEKRLWNQFASSREATDTFVLSEKMKVLQNRVIAAHASQAVFFDTIRKSNSNDLFSTREVLRLISQPMDYMEPPTTPVGYEYPDSKIRFEDFKNAIASV